MFLTALGIGKAQDFYGLPGACLRLHSLNALHVCMGTVALSLTRRSRHCLRFRGAKRWYLHGT